MGAASAPCGAGLPTRARLLAKPTVVPTALITPSQSISLPLSSALPRCPFVYNIAQVATRGAQRERESRRMRIAVLTATDSTSNAIKTVGISFEL